MAAAARRKAGGGRRGAGSRPGGQRTGVVSAGRAFGDYELLEEIARGGMGVVYRARQISLDRIVAVKMILAGEFASPEFVQRFRAEAAAAAVLHHPNIVAIHEVGESRGPALLLDGLRRGPKSGRSWCGERPLPARRAAQLRRRPSPRRFTTRMSTGILHRDLKPSNVLIDANRPAAHHRLRPGQAAWRARSSLTLSGQVLGSPNFMPPEQATAKHGSGGPAQRRLCAWAAILYHLLTARPPFQADSLETIVSQVLNSRAGFAAAAQPERAARPGDDLPEVPGEGAVAPLRHGPGAGG